DANAYYWEDQGDQPLTWPGVKMDHVSGNIYKIEVDAKYNRIIFNANGGQSDDLEVQGDGFIYSMSSKSWSKYNGGGNDDPIDPPTPGQFDYSNPRTIIVIDDGNWGSVYIHYWNGSGGTVWPGEQMTSIGQIDGSNAYAFTLDSQYTDFVINIGSNANQSANLAVGAAYQAFRTSSKSMVDASAYLK
ncbi:MAG: starch-binding protein, partial [Eubacteriales bacterium]|nr:starch-binding protein [Eubacteriales bacterium]